MLQTMARGETRQGPHLDQLASQEQELQPLLEAQGAAQGARLVLALQATRMAYEACTLCRAAQPAALEAVAPRTGRKLGVTQHQAPSRGAQQAGRLLAGQNSQKSQATCQEV